MARLRARARFSHRRRLTDDQRLWEHARYTSPRTEHGTALLTTPGHLSLSAVNRPTPISSSWPGSTSRSFNKRSWLMAASTTVACRRALAGQGGIGRSTGPGPLAPRNAVSRGPAPWMRGIGLEMLDKVGSFDSVLPALEHLCRVGAAEVLKPSPGQRQALDILDQCTRRIPLARDDERWPWPKDRHWSAGNARVRKLHYRRRSPRRHGRLVDPGLRLLQWLGETRHGHFSFAPSIGSQG